MATDARHGKHICVFTLEDHWCLFQLGASRHLPHGSRVTTVSERLAILHVHANQERVPVLPTHTQLQQPQQTQQTQQR